MNTITLKTDAALSLTITAFEKAGASHENASHTARALVQAEIDGQVGHGLTRIPSYAGQLKTGKVNPQAAPVVSSAPGKAGVFVDADFGFAYRAINAAIDALVPLTKDYGIASGFVSRSHHFGQAGAHAEKLADRGLIALVFGNSPKGIAFWGSNKPAMGTNPIAFAAPAPDGPPVVIDLAVSVAARGKIIAAQKNKTSIPEGWALDENGSPTTDPDAALRGSMMPVGGAKGAALAMMVEILSAALTGSHFGYEASSLFSDEGPSPNLGQTLIAIDPDYGSQGNYLNRMACLLGEIEAADGARLPGVSRIERRARALTDGLTIPETLYTEISDLAGAEA